MQVISVEIFVGWRAGEEQVEQLQYQKLKRGLTFAIEEKNDILSECFVLGAAHGQDINDPVIDLRRRRLRLLRGWIVSEDHILFVKNELDDSSVDERSFLSDVGLTKTRMTG